MDLDVNMEPVKVGNLINVLRTQKKMTQKQLAEKVHVTDKAVSKWERGECCPDISVLLMLRDLFDIPIENMMSGELPKEVQKNLAGKRVFLYDFGRPSLFGKNELRTVCNVAEIVVQKLSEIFTSVLGEKCSVGVASVDELTNEEFIRSVGNHSFYFDYDYNNLGFLIQVDDVLGKRLLKQNINDYRDLTKFDFEILQKYYVDSLASVLQHTIYENTDKSIAESDFLKQQKFTASQFVNLGQLGSQMCCLLTLKCHLVNSDGKYFEAMINIQFNVDYLRRTLKKMGFFGNEKKTLNSIKRVSNYNTFVEFGRFCSDDISFVPDEVIVLESKVSDGLMLTHNNKVLGYGEAVVVSSQNRNISKWGIKINRIEKENIIFDEKEYISIRLGCCNLSEEELLEVKEEFVLELSEDLGTPVAILKNGKKVAQGEIVICGENFGVRILE